MEFESDLQNGAYRYLASATRFLNREGIPGFLHSPIDHLAYKASNATHFDQLLGGLIGYLADDVYLSVLDRRRIAVARLKTPIHLGGNLAPVRTLELMEPRPEKVGHDIVGVEHIEMYRPYLGIVERELATLGQTESNSAHQTFVIKINEEGQEIKFTDRLLMDIIAEQLQTRETTKIK